MQYFSPANTYLEAFLDKTNTGNDDEKIYVSLICWWLVTEIWGLFLKAGMSLPRKYYC